VQRLVCENFKTGPGLIEAAAGLQRPVRLRLDDSAPADDSYRRLRESPDGCECIVASSTRALMYALLDEAQGNVHDNFQPLTPLCSYHRWPSSSSTPLAT
jgi:hypothetical protein